MSYSQGSGKTVNTQGFLSVLFEGREPYVIGRAPGEVGGWVGWLASGPHQHGPGGRSVFSGVYRPGPEDLGHKRENLDEVPFVSILDDVKKPHMASQIQSVLGHAGFPASRQARKTIAGTTS